MNDLDRHEASLKARGWLDEYEAETASAMNFGEGAAEERRQWQPCQQTHARGTTHYHRFRGRVARPSPTVVTCWRCMSDDHSTLEHDDARCERSLEGRRDACGRKAVARLSGQWLCARHHRRGDGIYRSGVTRR